MRERGQVAAVHLIGNDAQPLAHDPPLEVGREEPIVAAQEEPGRYVGPRRAYSEKPADSSAQGRFGATTS